MTRDLAAWIMSARRHGGGSPPPPPPPPPANPYDLLLAFTGSGGETTFTDTGAHAFTGIEATGTGCEISTTISKWGEGALYCPGGSGGYCVVPPETALAIGTGPFTLGGWFYFVETPPYLNVYVDWADPAGGGARANGLAMYTHADDSYPAYHALYQNSTDDYVSFPESGARWLWLTLERNSSGVIHFYADGTNQGTTSNDFDFAEAQLCIGGGSLSAGDSFQGYINDFFVKVGVCDHPDGTAYSPPTGPLSA